MSATQAKDGMKAAIDHLDDELRNIRTGRANPAIIETVKAEVYGTPMNIRDIANITTPEPRQLLITPYDNNNGGAIRNAIEKANLNLNPVLDGHVIRITIAPMDEAQRKEMAKMAHRKGEEAKVSIRNCRRDANEAARKAKADGDMTEDDLKRAEKEIQDHTDKFCKIVDERVAKKESEISEI